MLKLNYAISLSFIIKALFHNEQYQSQKINANLRFQDIKNRK